MRIGIAAALAGTLLLAGTAFATATPLVNLKGAAGSAPGNIDLVKGPGGHFGGHMGGGRMGGGRMGGVHMGGPRMGGNFARGGIGRPGFAGRSHRGGNFAYRGRGPYHGNYAYRNWNRYGHHGHRRYYGYYGGYFWPGIGLYSYGYGGGCGWLYSRARVTGSPYWWQRYQACLYGY